MPPKPKFTKDEIITAAYEVAKSSGIDAVVARTVGKKLDSTSTPIFTFFNGMEELKKEVYKRAKAECLAFLGDSVHYFPAFKEFGMRWIRFAIDNPNLFRLLFTDNEQYAEVPSNPMLEFSDVAVPILKSISAGFNIGEDEARNLFNQMILHANGIALFCMSHPGYLDEAAISRLLSECCISLVVVEKINNGSFDIDIARKMLAAGTNMPARRE